MPLYDNCEIHAPDGRFIGFCDKSRFAWFVRRGIAEQLSDVSLRLIKEPKVTREVSKIPRKNICSACGNAENLVKYKIVPIEFKKWFPSEVKSHNSRDVLLLCNECGSDANYFSNIFKKELEKEFKITEDDFIDKETKNIANLASKILNKQKSYDIDKLKCIINRIPTNDELLVLSTKDYKVQKDGCSNVCEYIVKNIINDNNINDFIDRWRINFLTTLEPKFLPQDF
jgi:hypothetical protein